MSPPAARVHRSRSDAIEALPSSTRLLLRSTLALPTLASLLALLVHNALDAGARRIAVTLCLGPDDTADGPTPFIECADDGAGFAEAWLRTQEERVGSLAHAATVGGLSVETSVNGKRWSLIRRDGRTLHSGSMDSMPRSLRSQSSASRSAEVARDRGSVVRVDDLYSALPVRRTALQRSVSASCTACASMFSMFALSAPRTQMTLCLRRDGKERVLARFAATESLMHRLGDALDIELCDRDVSPIDVLLPLTSSVSQHESTAVEAPRGTVRVRGLLALRSVPRGGQAIFWAGAPVFDDSAEGAALHDGVRSVFARSTYARSASGSPVKSPRAGYVLHLDVVLEAAYDAQEIVTREEGLVLGAVDSILQSVVADELCKRGLLAAPRRSKRAAAEGLQRAETAPPAPRLAMESDASISSHPKRPRTSLGQRVAELAAARSVPSDAAAATLPTAAASQPRLPRLARPPSRLTKADFSRPRSDDPQAAPPDWLAQSLAGLVDPVLPRSTEADISSLDTAVLEAPASPEISPSRASRHARLSAHSARANAVPLPAAQLASRFFGGLPGGNDAQALRTSSLQDARVIEQIDRKFIASTIRLEEQHALVLLDQHAADERVRFELMLQPFLHGALTNAAASSILSAAQSIFLTPRSVSSLLEPSHAHSVARFGFLLGASSSSDLIDVHAVPSLLRERLGERETLSQTLQSIVEWLQDGGAGALEAAARLYVRDEPSGGNERLWMRGMRHLPSRLAELIASKACRGAIMFNDALEKEQCQRLLAQLAGTALPFQCAHGRPTMIPLCQLSSASVRRPVDWARLADA